MANAANVLDGVEENLRELKIDVPQEDLPLSTEERELFLLEGEGILFCPSTEQLFYLNTTAAYLWCCLEEGLDPSSIASLISGQFGVPLPQAKQDVDTSLRQWKSYGLADSTPLEVGLTGFPQSASYQKETKRVGAPDTEVVSCRHGVREMSGQDFENSGNSHTLRGSDAAAQLSGGFERHYGIGQICLSIRYATQKSESIIHPNFAHLEAEPVPSADLPSAALRIGGDGPDFSLHRDGVKLNDSVSSTELLPLVQREILRTFYDLSGCLTGIHAAALKYGHGCLLMPGAPGSGKSTLTAALIRSGFTYLTDELALLMPTTYNIRTVPLALGLKRGSWTLLESQSPAIESVPIFRQQDGTEVKYLAPPKNQLAVHNECAVDKVVFPSYTANGPCGIRKVSSGEALLRLAEAGYAVPGGLKSSLVSELIDWIKRLDCYELRVCDLDRAVLELKGLLA